MRIILRQDFESLGKAGDVVTVKDGYARNFLLPKKIAVVSTPSNMKILEEEHKLLPRSIRILSENKVKLENNKVRIEKYSVECLH